MDRRVLAGGMTFLAIAQSTKGMDNQFILCRKSTRSQFLCDKLLDVGRKCGTHAKDSKGFCTKFIPHVLLANSFLIIPFLPPLRLFQQRGSGVFAAVGRCFK